MAASQSTTTSSASNDRERNKRCTYKKAHCEVPRVYSKGTHRGLFCMYNARKRVEPAAHEVGAGEHRLRKRVRK